MESIKKQYNDRSAYQGETILGKDLTLSTDIWESGLNNNMLVLGSSGAGKTRNVVKPNLMQMHGSYVVLDTKGQLHKEVASPARFPESMSFTRIIPLKQHIHLLIKQVSIPLYSTLQKEACYTTRMLLLM